MLKYFVFILFIAAPCNAQSCYWELSHPYAGANGFYGVWGFSPTEYYVTSEEEVFLYTGADFKPLHAGDIVPRKIWGTWKDLFGINAEYIIHYNGGTWDTEVSGNNLTSIWGSSAGDVFATGAYEPFTSFDPTAGWITHYNGVTWRKTYYCDESLMDIWGFSPTEVYAIGYYYMYDSLYGPIGPYGEMFRYDGSRWTWWRSAPMNYPCCIWGTSATDFYVAGNNAFSFTAVKVYHYDGSSFSDTRYPSASIIEELWGTASDDIYGVSGREIFHYDGATWSKTADAGIGIEFESIWGVSSTDVMAVCEGSILHFDGATWNSVPTGLTDETIEGIWAITPDDVYAAGFDGSILHFNGLYWTSVFNDRDKSFYGVWGASPDVIYAVGAESGAGIVMKYDGSLWTKLTNPVCLGSFNGVWGLHASDVFAVGSGGALAHYNGVTWNFIPTKTSYRLYDIWGSDWDNLFVVGERGFILHYNGTTWSQSDSSTTADLRCIWGSSGTDIYSNNIHYNGTAWSPILMMPVPILDIWGSSSTDIYALGFYFTPMRHYDGFTWTTFTPGFQKWKGIKTIRGVSKDDIFVAGENAVILKYTCPGSTVVPIGVRVGMVFLLIITMVLCWSKRYRFNNDY